MNVHHQHSRTLLGLAERTSSDTEAAVIIAAAHAEATLALADAQERTATALEARVRLAALTAQHKGIPLPDDLEDLTA